MILDDLYSTICTLLEKTIITEEILECKEVEMFYSEEMMEISDQDEFAKKIIKIYNVTSDRKNKQRNHQELCILFSILNKGPNVYYKDGIEISNTRV